MKKKVFILSTVLTLVAVLMLVGCGVQGEKGAKGNKGDAGRDGLSAYEIFCKNYIYIESEKQWIDDLVAGRLEKIDNSVLEKKYYWDGSIDDDFVEDEIILVTDKYFRNKTFTVDDFHMIEAEKVELTAAFTDENKYYLITIKNKGKQNVIDAVHKLEIYAFAKIVEPNLIFGVADDHK